MYLMNYIFLLQHSSEMTAYAKISIQVIHLTVVVFNFSELSNAKPGGIFRFPINERFLPAIL